MPYPLVEKVKIAESEVVEIWKSQLLDRAELATEGGKSLRIIYPGRVNNDGQGADFRDAVIIINQKVTKGDIEIHTKSSAWRAHRHYDNPAYNQVILHVVMWHDTAEATILQNREIVPVLSLEKYIKNPIDQQNWIYHPAGLREPCLRAIKPLHIGAITEFLDTAGRERFLTKAKGFQTELAQTDASQCLYQGIMAALGYSKNKLPCLELACRVPLQILESMAQGEITEEESLARQQALLLGTAGLLPSQFQSRRRGNG